MVRLAFVLLRGSGSYPCPEYQLSPENLSPPAGSYLPRMYDRPIPRRAFVLPCVVCSLALASLVTLVSAAEGPDELKAQADRWIELEKNLADERNAWRPQKEALEASIHVLKSEQTTLQTRVEGNELAAAAFRNRLEVARADFAQQEAGHTILAAACQKLEQRLSALLPRLPGPLQERVQPHLTKLRSPAGDDGATISERAQSLVSALTAIEQFNNSLTLTHELRPNGAGETVDVKVLYWGLSGAYAIDATGANAWILAPGRNGWEWRDAPAEAAAIRSLISVHEKQQNPSFVVLPIGTQGGAQ